MGRTRGGGDTGSRTGWRISLGSVRGGQGWKRSGQFPSAVKDKEGHLWGARGLEQERARL